MAKDKITIIFPVRAVVAAITNAYPGIGERDAEDLAGQIRMRLQDANSDCLVIEESEGNAVEYLVSASASASLEAFRADFIRQAEAGMFVEVDGETFEIAEVQADRDRVRYLDEGVERGITTLEYLFEHGAALRN